MCVARIVIVGDSENVKRVVNRTKTVPSVRVESILIQKIPAVGWQ
jgi:hypothetical protein